MSNVRSGAFWTHSREVAEAPCQKNNSKIIFLSAKKVTDFGYPKACRFRK
jgi:hypothetical protein